MNQKNLLQTQAILASKNQNWTKAISYNQQILDTNPKDIGALSRMGIAWLQLNNKQAAKQCFEKILTLEKNNSIAQKYLTKIKHNQKIQAPNFNNDHFIEEPGKTKTTKLHRLASKEILNNLNAGQKCDLKPKNRYISVETNHQYIGALPEDLSFRLTKLIKTGNKYDCWIRSIEDTNCYVFIKEIFRSPKNKNIPSFCINKGSLNQFDSFDENISKEKVPIVIVNTDDDSENLDENITVNDFDDQALED